MNIARIQSAAKNIANCEVALKWLEEYGLKLDPHGADFKVRIDLHRGGSCLGAKEASDVLSSYASLELPIIVETAIRSCRNTIKIESDAIRAELDSAE